MKEKCKWVYDNFHDFWETECGNAFTVLEGTPSDNKMRFCPYCGKEIKESNNDCR